MQLDFTGLDKLSKNDNKSLTTDATAPINERIEPKEIKDSKYTRSEEKPLKHSKNAYESASEKKLIKIQSNYEKVSKAMKEHQENTLKAGTYRSKLLKGIQAGENPQNLLLKAIECISIMTNDKLFLEQAKNDYIAIYGEGLKQEIPLKWELEETLERLKKLETALKSINNLDKKDRIKKAIAAHKSQAQDIENKIRRIKEEDDGMEIIV